MATVTAPMKAKAATIAALLPTFSTGTSKITGQRFYIVPASNRLTAHWTEITGAGCTCIGFQRRGVCTHAIAAQTLHERAEMERTLADILGPRCPDGPAIREVRGRFEAAFPRYDEAFPSCRVAGCDNDPEPKSQDCYRHQLVDAF